MPESVSQTFAGRHIGPRADDTARMLETLGYDSLDALMQAAVPGRIRTAADWAACAADSAVSASPWSSSRAALSADPQGSWPISGLVTTSSSVRTGAVGPVAVADGDSFGEVGAGHAEPALMSAVRVASSTSYSWPPM